MPPGGYGADPDLGVIGDVLRYLAEIGAGRTSITDEDLANAPSDLIRELLVGLLTLHEDLQYERDLRATAEQQSDRLVADLRAAVGFRAGPRPGRDGPHGASCITPGRARDRRRPRCDAGGGQPLRALLR